MILFITNLHSVLHLNAYNLKCLFQFFIYYLFIYFFFIIFCLFKIIIWDWEKKKKKKTRRFIVDLGWGKMYLTNP